MTPELNKLLEACQEALCFVGMANYAERQRYADEGIERMFNAYSAGKNDEIVFGYSKSTKNGDFTLHDFGCRN